MTGWQRHLEEIQIRDGLSYFSIAVLSCRDQGTVTKNELIGLTVPKGKFMTLMIGSKVRQSWCWISSWELMSDPQAGCWDRDYWEGVDFWNNKASSKWHNCPSKAVSPNTKQFYQLGTKHSDAWVYGAVPCHTTLWWWWALLFLLLSLLR